MASVNSVSAEHSQPLDFLQAKALGTGTPAKCKVCQTCKECKFRADSISFKENKEYKVIINEYQLGVGKKKWTAIYPFCVSGSTFTDNYRQARKYMETQKRQLIKLGRVEELNSEFCDTVERGVFWKLSL
jgi:hypothetical protein